MSENIVQFTTRKRTRPAICPLCRDAALQWFIPEMDAVINKSGVLRDDPHRPSPTVLPPVVLRDIPQRQALVPPGRPYLRGLLLGFAFGLLGGALLATVAWGQASRDVSGSLIISAVRIVGAQP